MARNKKKKSSETPNTFKFISKETLNTILGVFSFVAAIFLLLGAFGLAGRAGELVYGWLTYLFGIGYYLLAMVFLVLATSFLQDREREFAMPQALGSVALFISSLGLVNLISSDGGVVADLISNPLVSLFDVYISGVVLFALLVISILIIFDTSIKINFATLLKRLFGRKAI